MHEWLSVIIVLLIVGVLLDGIRRMRQMKKEKIKLADTNDELDDDLDGSEFPSGGARVAGYRADEDCSQMNEAIKNNLEEKKKTVGVKYKEMEQVGLELEEPVPEAEPPNVPQADPFTGETFSNEPALGNLDDLIGFDDDGLSKPRARARSANEVAPQVLSEPRQDPRPAKSSEAAFNSHPPASETQTGETQTSAVVEDDYDDDYDEGNHEVIIIHVCANPGYVYTGEDLLRSITSQGMRFGAMDIFHRHEKEDGSGPIMFSMVNMLKPGTFDLSNMETFETPGVSLFMNLPIKGDSLHAFRTMTKVAKGLITDLGGEMKDENRSVMTQQTIEHCRQRVIEFDRQQRLENA